MKRFSTLFTMALIAMFSLSLTSCDEDAAIDYTLQGTWKGNMYVTSEYNNVTYDATYTEIDFSAGIWIDYYSNAPYDYLMNHIQWTVRDGVIYVHFVEENTDITIHNYSLSDSYFSGIIWSGSNRVDFSMRHISSPNWNDYYYYDSDDWYNSWGYSKTGGFLTRSATDSIAAPKRGFRTK